MYYVHTILMQMNIQNYQNDILHSGWHSIKWEGPVGMYEILLKI